MSTRFLAIAIAVGLYGPALAQDHSQHQQDHSQHQQHQQHQQQDRSLPQQQRQDHSQHLPPAVAPAHPHEHHDASEKTSQYQPPALTDADRKAAFPDLTGHDMGAHMDDDPFVWMVLVDRLEWQQAETDHALAWDAKAWFGHDDNRLWLRTEGKGEPPEHGRIEHADIEVLWGKPISPWWDVLFGIRHDFEPGPKQDWATIGVQGLAPYKFEVEATAFVGEGGQTAAQLEVEYELLLTNRLILQPRIEAVLHGRDDEERGIGSGLSEMDAGLRLRYEIRREFAPYLGVEWGRSFGATADFARAAGEDLEDLRFLAGVRFWF